MLKNKTLYLLPFLFCVYFLTSCQNLSEKKLWPDLEKPRVVCTTEMLHALVASIGKEDVQYQVLISGELDPHSYQLVKGDGEKLATAQRIFSNGLLLEHGPSLKKFLEKSDANISLGDRLFVAFAEDLLSVSGQVDPHIWMDLSLFIKLNFDIAKELSLLVPAKRELFYGRARRMSHYVMLAHDYLVEFMQALPSHKRYLVTSHDAFHYFTRAYIASAAETRKGAVDQVWMSRMIAAEGLAPESQISISQIARVADYMARYDVRTVFAESNINTDAIRKIESVMQYRKLPVKISTKPLYGDSMPSKVAYQNIKDSSPLFAKVLDVMKLPNQRAGMEQAQSPDAIHRNIGDLHEPGGQFLHYIAMIVHNVETIHEHLSADVLLSD